jgi:hypothetical protein
VGKQTKNTSLKNMSTKNIIAVVAFAGLVSGAYATQSNNAQKANSLGTSIEKMADKGQHTCKGHNECKGNGGCKTGDNGCKGKNSCKGKGGCSTMPKK